MGLRTANCQKQDIRVQPIPGGKIKDIKENLDDLLHKEVQKVIIHIGTNNAMTNTPKEIFRKLISLKTPNQEYSDEMWVYH